MLKKGKTADKDEDDKEEVEESIEEEIIEEAYDPEHVKSIVDRHEKEVIKLKWIVQKKTHKVSQLHLTMVNADTTIY